MKNKFLLFFGALFFIVILTSISTAPLQDWVIDGNKVYINDSKVFISAEPHTIQDSSYVYFNLTSKIYEGNIDIVFGFDTSLIKPKKAELLNSTGDWKDYSQVFSVVSYNYSGMNKWYYVKNIPIQVNKSYLFRGYVEITPQFGKNSGKYWFAIKPSSETIQEAIANNHFYALDPWWDANYYNKQEITIANDYTNLENFTVAINITYSIGMMSNFSDIRFINGSCDSPQDTSLFFVKNNFTYSGNATFWVLIPKLYNGGNKICMYYNNSAAGQGENYLSTFSNYWSVWGFEAENITDYVTGVVPVTYSLTGWNRSLFGQSVKMLGGTTWINTDVYLANTPLFGSTNSNFSIEFWMELSSGTTTSANPLLIGTQNTVSKPWWEIYVYSDNAYYKSLTDGIENISSCTFNSIADGKYHYFVFKRNYTSSDAIQNCWYLDGVLKGCDTKIHFIPNTNAVLMINRQDSSYGHTIIDELRITFNSSDMLHDRIVRSYENADFTKISFGVSESSVTNPLLEIESPESKAYSIAQIDFNVSSNKQLSLCKFSIGNTNYTMTNFNTTYTNYTNTSVLEGSYTAKFWCNDTIGNINHTESIIFSISTTAPAINLDYPQNNTLLNNRTVYFNFTATDSDGVDNCELWGNWTGTWIKNYTWDKINSGFQNYTILNLADGTWIWNVWCNDTASNGKFVLNNYTVKIDTIAPYVKIVSPISGYSFEGSSFTLIYNISEDNINTYEYNLYSGTCSYSANLTLPSSGYNSSSIIVPCGYKTYNLFVYGEDLAGNLNYTSISITSTEPLGGVGGGGGGTAAPPIIYIIVATLKQPEDPDIFASLDKKLSATSDRAKLFASIFRKCNEKVPCGFTSIGISDLKVNLSVSYDLDISEEDLKIWIEQYNSNMIEDKEVEESIVNKYNLIKKVVTVEVKEFKILPSRVDRPWLWRKSSPVFNQEIQANKNLANCSVSNGAFKINADCSIIEKSTALFSYKLDKLDEFSKVIKGQIRIESVDGFVVYIPIILRVYKFNTVLYIIGSIIIIGVIGYFVYKKRKK